MSRLGRMLNKNRLRITFIFLYVLIFIMLSVNLGFVVRNMTAWDVKHTDATGVQSGKRIPKIIHLTWKSGMIPVKVIPWIRKWPHTNPDYEIWFWTDSDVSLFVRSFYPAFIDLFHKYEMGINRADVMRYLVLYHFGGFYSDLDMEPLKSLDPLREEHSCIMAREPPVHAHVSWGLPIDKPLACNAFMASRPRHPFLRLLMDLLELNRGKENPVEATGPMMVTHALQTYQNMRHLMQGSSPGDDDDVFLSPSVYFNPSVDGFVIHRLREKCSDKDLDVTLVHFCSKIESPAWNNGPTVDSYTSHHWWHSWVSDDDKTNSESRYIAHVIPNVRYAKEIINEELKIRDQENELFKP